MDHRSQEPPDRVTEPGSVIVRTWTATATPSGADRYRQYFAETLLSQLHDLPGFLRGYLLSRELNDSDGTIELTTHTFWESIEAVHAFAGQNVTTSVVEPEAQAVLLQFDRTATHFRLWVDR